MSPVAPRPGTSRRRSAGSVAVSGTVARRAAEGEEARRGIATNEGREGPGDRHEQREHEAGHRPARDAGNEGPRVGREARELCQRELGEAGGERARERGVLAHRVEVEAGPGRAVAEVCVDCTPRDDDRAVGDEARDARAARRGVEERGVRDEVAGDAEHRFAGEQADGEDERRDHGARDRPRATASMREQREEREGGGDERVAVGEPGEGKSVRGVDGVEERGPCGDRARADHAAVHAHREPRDERVPDEALRVHERGVLGPERVVEHVRRGRDGPQEREAQAVVGEPRKEADAAEAADVLGTTVGEREEIDERALADEARPGLRVEPRELDPVVADAAPGEGREPHDPRDHHDPPGDPPARQDFLDGPSYAVAAKSSPPWVSGETRGLGGAFPGVRPR